MQRVTFSATPLGSSAKPFSKSALTRHVGRLHQLAEMREHLVAALRAVGVALRVGVAGTGGRQRLEAEALQIARAADIPRIGNDEAAGLVQLAKRLALFGDGRREDCRIGEHR